MSESAALSENLSLCGSAPHRAVLGVLMASMGRPVADSLLADLKASPPEHLAAITNQSHGQTILHSAFERDPALAGAIPRDLAIYFKEMQRANRDRNAQAITQLQEIAAILQPHGIPILALKGAADVLSPIHATPAHRYISDLDLMIPAEQISQAARLLRQAMGLPTKDRLLEPGAHHHLAQITTPDWLFTVELHVRPGSDLVAGVLAAPDMLAQAEHSGIAGVQIPCPQHRFVHHLLHGLELRHETAALNLRLLADHAAYLETLPQSGLNKALILLKTSNLDSWAQDLTQLVQGLSGKIALPPDSWAAQALINFGNPETARDQDSSFWLRHYLRRLKSSGAYRRQVLRKVISPAAWAEFLAFHRDRRSKFK